MKTSRTGNITGALAALLCACGLVACTTTEADSEGTGGSGGSGGGTTTPVGSGGAGPVGGAAGGEGTLCPPPQQIITDFTYVPAGTGGSTTEVRFGGAGTLQGGQSYYPNTGTYPLTVDVTQSSFHITGTVGDYSGFALYFDNCDHLDASQFKGIRFTISGSVPQGNAITMGVGTIDDTPTGTWMRDVGGDTTALPTDSGRCTPTSGTQYYHPGCSDPQVKVAVPATPTVTDVPWANLTGGAPVLSPKPAEITSIYWFFPWSDGGTPYAVDLVIDDLQFIP
jgi:hypothetical protein